MEGCSVDICGMWRGGGGEWDVGGEGVGGEAKI